MNSKFKKSLFDRAIKKWGILSVETVTIEECSELIKAITKIHRRRVAKIKVQPSLLDGLVDEIADVEICVERMRQAYRIDNRVEDRVDEKLYRLARRLRDKKRKHA